MNMMLTLYTYEKLEDGYEKKLEITPEDKLYEKIRLTIADNHEQSLSVVVSIDDLRKALSAVKSLK